MDSDEVVSWHPTAQINTLKQRANLLQAIRNFFNHRGFWEVETPILGQAGITDPYLENMQTQFRGETFYLQTSPEYHMKRLLAAGSGSIFQLSKAFREDELGRWHNPEFTLLEWYQQEVDHHGLMDGVDAFLNEILGSAALERISYQTLFEQTCGINPFADSVDTLYDCLKQNQIEVVHSEEPNPKDMCLFLILTHLIEPQLAKKPNPIAIYGFPESQAALAQVKEGRAERFEVYFKGIELANGFHELRDTALQRGRFEADNKLRVQLGKPPKSMDERFLAALASGLPPCSGVALGVDRLLALKMGFDAISSVLSFNCEMA